MELYLVALQLEEVGNELARDLIVGVHCMANSADHAIDIAHRNIRANYHEREWQIMANCKVKPAATEISQYIKNELTEMGKTLSEENYESCAQSPDEWDFL